MRGPLLARSVALALACFCALSARAEQPESIHLEYDAPARCADAEAFVKEVHARTTRFVLLPAAPSNDPSHAVRTFSVRIEPSHSGFHGDLRVVDVHGGVSQRSVDGGRCDEVASALALVVAVSIDPAASVAPPAGSASPIPTAALPAALPSPVAPAPTPPAPTPAPPAPTPAPPAPAPAPAPATPPEINDGTPPALAPFAPRAWRWTAGLGASVEGFAAPGVVLGELGFFGVVFDREPLWSPEVRLGAAHASSGTLAAAQGQVGFEWTVGRLEACPARWMLGPVELRPCARGDVGALAASANGVPHAKSPTRPWGALGASLLFEWALAGPLVLSLEGALSAPLVREQFFVAPVPNVYQAPVVVAGGDLGLGVRFP